MVQWLRLRLPVQGLWFSLRAEIPHASRRKSQNINNRNNIITSSIEILKMVHIKTRNFFKE